MLVPKGRNFNQTKSLQLPTKPNRQPVSKDEALLRRGGDHRMWSFVHDLFEELHVEEQAPLLPI